MKFIIRKTWIGASALSDRYLACGKGKQFKWGSVANATRFDDVGTAALRAEKLGLGAHEVTVEAVAS